MNVGEAVRAKRVATALALACVLVTALALCDTALGKKPTAYETNARGETYGFAVDERGNALAAPPDLIAAIATNGERGYLRADEYHAAQDEQRRSLSDEEFRVYAETRQNALKQAFSEYLGCDLLSTDAAAECLGAKETSGGMERAAALASEELSLSLTEAVRSGTLPAEDAQVLLQGELVSLSLPAAAPAPLKAQAGELSAQQLETAVKAEGARFKVAIGKDTFEREILPLAQAKTATMLPVYASDGVTVIGEFALNSM